MFNEHLQNWLCFNRFVNRVELVILTDSDQWQAISVNVQPQPQVEKNR